MSNVTRFGPQPLLDNEIANKAYVDAGGGGGGDKITLIGFCGNHVTNPTNDTTFAIINSWVVTSFTGRNTESLMQLAIDWDLTIKRVLLRITINSENDDVIFGFRDDGVTVASITVASSTTGQFDTGDLTVLILSGSELNWIIDSAGNTGNFGDYSLSAWGFET